MLRVGIIGMGVGEQHIAGFTIPEHSTVTCICDNDIEKLAEVSSRHNHIQTSLDANEILLDPTIDIVSIASFDEFHADQVISAFDNRKHVFVEKPLCLTQSELDQIKEARDRAIKKGFSPKLSTNFILRREQRFLKLKERISAGDLGEIYLVEGCYDYGRMSKLLGGWRSETPNYSVMHGGGIHVLDLCQWLTGVRFAPHSALSHKFATLNTNFLPPDLITSLGRFGSKIVGRVSANFGSQTRHFHQIKLYGTKGSFIHDCGKTTYFWGSEPEVGEEQDLQPFPSSRKGDLIPIFVESILADAETEIDIDYVFDVMQTSIDIDQMAQRT